MVTQQSSIIPQAGKAKPFGVVYLAVNKKNGKRYVGQTRKAFRKRIMEHRRGSGGRPLTVFGHALRKYGLDGFNYAILENCASVDAMNEAEIYWIRELNCRAPFGYNRSDGGEGIRGLSEESLAKMRLINLGRKHTEAAKEKNRQAHLGKKHSAETRRKHSEALKAHYAREQHHMVGKKHSEEVKAKMSRSQKGRNAGAKNGRYGKPGTQLGKKRTPEQIEKNRQAKLAAWKDPEYRAKMTEAHKHRPPQSQDTRRKRAVAIRKTRAAKRGGRTLFDHLEDSA